MVKWPFRRNSEDDDQPQYQVPAEIQDYYQAERRERTGVAWLMATGTLIVTILLAVGLFFGGRWIYRKVKGNDSQQIATSNVESVQQATSENETSGPKTSSTNTEQPSPAPATPPPSTPPAASTPTPTPTPSTTSPSPSNSTPPATAGAYTSIPNTGPGDTAAIVLAVAVIAALGHYAVATRRSSGS